MTENQNIETVQSLYAAFNRGDIPFILDRLTPDVRWQSYGEAGVPWSGDHSGPRVPDFFNAIAANADVLAFEPGEYIAQGDTVISWGDFAAAGKATGKSAQSKWIFIWKLRNGLVYSYEQFHEPTLAQIFA